MIKLKNIIPFFLVFLFFIAVLLKKETKIVDTTNACEFVISTNFTNNIKNIFLEIEFINSEKFEKKKIQINNLNNVNIHECFNLNNYTLNNIRFVITTFDTSNVYIQPIKIKYKSNLASINCNYIYDYFYFNKHTNVDTYHCKLKNKKNKIKITSNRNLIKSLIK